MLPACNLPEPMDIPAALPAAGTTAGRQLRVLLVAHALEEEPRAGTETYVAGLGKALGDLGVEVLFLAPGGPSSAGPGEAVPWRKALLQGRPFLQLGRTNQELVSLSRHPGFEAAFRDILKQQRVDLIHFHHTYLSSISLLEVGLDLGLPVILTLHDAWHLCPRLHCVNDRGYCGGPEDLSRCVSCLESWLGAPTPENRERLRQILTHRRGYVQSLLARCRLLAPSRFLRNLHYRCGVAPGGIIHLPLGLDELGPAPRALPEHPPRFVFLGNIVPVKRMDLAVEAFIPLAGQAVLEIWGGVFQSHQKELLESLAPLPHIRYRGPYRRAELPRLLSGAAALIMCSDFENYPLVAREGLMLGVPVIASRAGGLPEIVRHGVNGLLFPPGDAAALRRQVTRLLRRPALLDRLRQGITPVKTVAAEARELLDLYRSLTVPPAPGPPEIKARPVPDPRRVTVSIIIPTFNNLDLTRQCLESIRGHTDPGAYEVIVVDNGSTDGTPAYLREEEAACRLTAILNRENLGFAKASNQGAAAAAGEFLLFLNNDTIVTDGWLQGMCRCARADERIAAVGAKLLYPDDTVQHAGAVFNRNKNIYHIYRHLHKDHPAVNQERDFQVLTAACLLVKKEAFETLGPFDEQFKNGFEDVDLCLKLREGGYRLVYTPGAMVYHLESQTKGRFDYERQNARLLSGRWGEAISADDESYYNQDGITSRTLVDPDGNIRIIMQDQNDNGFWHEARRLAAAGRDQEAAQTYFLALRFNPFDTRLPVIADELAGILEKFGKFEEAAALRAEIDQRQRIPGVGN